MLVNCLFACIGSCLGLPRVRAKFGGNPTLRRSPLCLGHTRLPTRVALLSLFMV